MSSPLASNAVRCLIFWKAISRFTSLSTMPAEDLTSTSRWCWIVYKEKSMQTTDKLKKSTYTTPLTGINLDATFMSGQSYVELIRKVVRIGIGDLGANNRKLRDDAMRYILSRQFQVDCKTINLDYYQIIKAIATLNGMSQPQRHARIKQLLRLNDL